MGNVTDQTVICKCLNLLNISDDAFPLYNYRIRKLTLGKAIKLFIDASLNKRSDLDDIANHLRASRTAQVAFGIDSISASQLSRTLADLPLDVLQQIFLQINQKLNAQHRSGQGIPGIGKLRIIDSTILTLPEIAGKWAYCSKDGNGVKIHTQLLVADADTVFPDKVICSTRGIADSEVALELVVERDAVHVMDRGYIVYRDYKEWNDKQIRFVARIQKRNKTTIVRERDTDKAANVQRDADVTVTYKDENKNVIEVMLRLVEFTDEKGRPYRVLTNLWDVPAAHICEMYRHRWIIELFFKWIKQHLSLVHLYGVGPRAVWNQIFITLIAYGLVLLIKQEATTKRTAWGMLKLLRQYWEHSWEAFIAELNRDPTRKSKGRRKKKKIGRPRKHPITYKTVRVVVE